MAYVSQLYIYPVKSLGGIALQEAQVTRRGLQFDRRWMLVDEHNIFMTQRKYPKMAFFSVQITEAGLLVQYKPTGEDAIIPFQPNTNHKVNVKVWDDACVGTHVDAALDNWFTERLGMPCRLIHMADDSIRAVDTKYAGPDHITSFADDYPMLLISEASLKDLNSRLTSDIVMERFRPNVVISNTEPYFEDLLQHYQVAGIDMFGVKPCARCVMVGIDPATAIAGPEPLRTLATYRRMGNKILFGQNLVHRGEGMIRIGDKLDIKRLGTPPELTASVAVNKQ